MSSVNRVILLGNIGKPPELKHGQSGVASCRFSLATSDRWVDQDGQKHVKTEWHQVVAFRKQAENVAKYCGKGSKVYVEGRLTTRSWEDQQGQKRYSADVIADVVKFLSAAQEENPGLEPRTRSSRQPEVPAQMGDQDLGNVPF
ncbi:MAG TPA: single-stranded DNA-binding protein [Oligoflexus sp.]|uniref:single-stranded DNA-binding protein n=1 Tax=Oligoflexus sp. TaxID=1971216 RepID=UPI002D3543CE|nr:single-stranded DNA-binding protein [Oligoflexus sp.]HYX35808.1 single-stranded DNA-binding protein [Oligoflexus sp.]